MAFLRKIGNVLGRTVGNCLNQETVVAKPFGLQALRCMSSSKLFIGGLSFSTDDMSLKEAFCKYGDVADAKVIVDRDTGRSRGFGFVTYSSVEEASAAIQALDQQDLHGRRIRVDYAADQTRGFGGGGGGFRGGNFGGYGGGSGGGYGGGGGYGNAGGYGGNYGGGSYGDSQNFDSPNSNYRSGSGADGYGAKDESFDRNYDDDVTDNNKYADGRN